MAPESRRFRWRWLWALSAVMASACIGCNPQFLTMALMPFSDNKEDPLCKIFTSDKEVTVAIVTNFIRPETNPDLQAADTDLAEQIAASFKVRCAENKHKLKLIPQAQIRNQQLKQQFGNAGGPVELGKNLKADFVLDVTIKSLSIYEKNYHPQMYCGRADVLVSMYSVAPKDGEHKIFSKEFRRVHPRDSGPIDAGSVSASAYRAVFLNKVASDISKMFIAYEPEKHFLE